MKPSQFIALFSISVGMLGAGAVWVNWLPNMTLLGFVILTFVIGGLLYRPLMEITALRKLADRE